MRRSLAIFAVAALCFASLLAAQTRPASDARKIGGFDFFGSEGMDVAALQKRLAPRVGQEVIAGRNTDFRRAVQGDVSDVTGKLATDVAVVCCDESGAVRVFVGLQGQTYEPLEYRNPPQGQATLPADGLSLYKQAGDASRAAVSSGKAREDDSQGYAISEEPALHALQTRMRTYALANESAIRNVLANSASVEQRRAAAELLGYAQRSSGQVNALTAAANDDDDDVRNNATRALAVVATSGLLPNFKVEPFIAMLYSGIWTDRNKAAFLLQAVTRSRDPKLLKALRTEATPALIEGARWHSRGHAYAFAVILGRLAGLDDKRINELIQANTLEPVIHALDQSQRK